MVLQEDCRERTRQADSFLVPGCGQGVHTAIDATDGAMIHPESGRCEVDPKRDCGWTLVCERPRRRNRMDLLEGCRKPKNHAK